MTPLFLDIECVARDDARERLVKSVSCPKTHKKPETVEAWEANERPAAEDKAWRDGALSALYGQILMIGDADGDEEPFVWHDDDERELLQRWVTCSICANEKPLSAQEPRLLVGHNIAGFDLKYIWQRCKILGVELPAWFPSPNQPEWKCDNVFDTMTAFAGNRGYVSLKELAWAMGIECNDDSSGADVHDLYRNGRMDLIVEHCRSDVALVREVYKRLTTSTHRSMKFATGAAAKREN